MWYIHSLHRVHPPDSLVTLTGYKTASIYDSFVAIYIGLCKNFLDGQRCPLILFHILCSDYLK